MAQYRFEGAYRRKQLIGLGVLKGVQGERITLVAEDSAGLDLHRQRMGRLVKVV